MILTKKQRFNKICKEIKSIKIQGAVNVAKAGFRAYKLIPTESSIKKLISLRPTEPMLFNVLKNAENLSLKNIDNYVKTTQDTINKEVLRLIKKNSVIFTHCHSSTVVNALINARKKGKIFEVYNTETRPLYQGRKTAIELIRAGIKVTFFTDSEIRIALTKSQETKSVDLVFLGADAILKNGVLNKIGSGMVAESAKLNHIPVYILANSWKYSSKSLKIEQRPFFELWKNKPQKIKIKNSAFEFIEKKYITGLISEFKILSFKKFLEKVQSS